MLGDIFGSLFAWSWTGHGALTGFAIAYAIGRLVSAGRTYILQRIDSVYNDMRKEGVYASKGGSGNVYFDPNEASQIQKEYSDDSGSIPAEVTHAFYVFSSLPSTVQCEDLHAGNIPWGVGEVLDSTGQVRHFMRSRPEVSS
jgi:hypothetical protein